MSLSLHAFLPKEAVPSREDWQSAIVLLGFDLQIDPNLKPFEDSGFLPCKLGEEDSGFEIYYEQSGDALEPYPHMKTKIGARDYAISFWWSGLKAEAACVFIAAAALVQSFDAMAYYPNDDQVYSLPDLLKEAREALLEL